MIDYGMKPDSGSLKLTGSDVRLTQTVIIKAIKKNWWVITLYVIVNIGGVVAAYFLDTPWVSAATCEYRKPHPH